MYAVIADEEAPPADPPKRSRKPKQGQAATSQPVPAVPAEPATSQPVPAEPATQPANRLEADSKARRKKAEETVAEDDRAPTLKYRTWSLSKQKEIAAREAARYAEKRRALLGDAADQPKLAGRQKAVVLDAFERDREKAKRKKLKLQLRATEERQSRLEGEFSAMAKALADAFAESAEDEPAASTPAASASAPPDSPRVGNSGAGNRRLALSGLPRSKSVTRCKR